MSLNDTGGSFFVRWVFMPYEFKLMKISDVVSEEDGPCLIFHIYFFDINLAS